MLLTKRIPVMILSGFLGAGKTTLLNHLLRSNHGYRIGVIVNDFGAVNVDALTVAGQVDAMISLANGCICCAVDEAGLTDLIGRLTDQRSDLDILVIEASGLADPRDLARMLWFSTHPGVEYGGLVQIVDAAEFAATRSRHPELVDHIGFADVIVVNKMDRLDEADRAEVMQSVEQVGNGIPILSTSHGRVAPEFLFEPRPRTGPESGQLSLSDLVHEHPAEDHHVHHAYQSVTFSSETPMHPRRFMEFVEQRNPGLYRMKGTVCFGEAGRGREFILQTVGIHVSFQPALPSPDDPTTTQIVMIGTGLNEDRLCAELRSCIQRGDDSLDDHSMLSVLRHLD